MPRASKSAPAEVEQSTPAGPPAPENENRSSETQVLLPADDEPVRCGGHVLTDQGWVVEHGDQVPEHDADAEGDPAPDNGQE